MEEGVTFSVRLIDCVGYMVPGAVGQYEDLSPRMVMTPWYDHEIPMTEAAELGTRKVICDHSTVGIVVTHRRQRHGDLPGGLSGGGGAVITESRSWESPSWWCSTRPTPIPTGTGHPGGHRLPL